MRPYWLAYTFVSDALPRYAPRTNTTREQLVRRIRDDSPPHVARFGDGEILCCLGWEERGNCDGHAYSPALAEALAAAVKQFVATPDLWLGNWFYWPLGTFIHGLAAEYGGQKLWCDHRVFMHINCFPLEPVRDLYVAIKASKRRKVLIGPAHVRPAIPRLRIATHVEVPTKNGWLQYRDVRERVLAAITPGDLVLIVFGMPAKPLMADIIRECPAARCFDIGSGLDPIVGRKNRLKQPEPAIIQNLYRDLLDA